MTNRIIPALLITLAFCACTTSRPAAGNNNDDSRSAGKGMYNSETFLLTGISEDSTFGYKSENAIKVGGKGTLSGPQRERFYLNALRGPEKEMVVYERKGSCCAAASKNGFGGLAMLDRYEVKYDGIETPIILYINMYDPGDMKAPQGFTYKK
jgi:hypothetical protein